MLFEGASPLNYPAMLQSLGTSYTTAASADQSELSGSLLSVDLAQMNAVPADYPMADGAAPNIALPALSFTNTPLETYAESAETDEQHNYVWFDDVPAPGAGVEAPEAGKVHPYVMRHDIVSERSSVESAFNTQKAYLEGKTGEGSFVPSLSGSLEGSPNLNPLVAPEFPAEAAALPSMDFLQTEHLDITASTQAQILEATKMGEFSLESKLTNFKEQHAVLAAGLGVTLSSLNTQVQAVVDAKIADSGSVKNQFVTEVAEKRQEFGDEIATAVSGYGTDAKNEKSAIEREIIGELNLGNQEIVSAVNDELDEGEQQSYQPIVQAKFLSSIGNFFEDAWNWVVDGFKKLGEFLSVINIANIKNFFKGGGDGNGGGENPLIKKFNEITTRVLNFAREKINSLISKLTGIANRVRTKINGVVQKVNEYWGGLQEKLNSMVNTSLTVVETIVQTVANAFGTAFNNMMEAARDFSEGAKDFVDGMLNGLTILKTLIDVVQEFMHNPNIFVAAASETVIGVDVTSPLPNEYLQAPSAEDEDLREIPEENLDLLAKEAFAEEDFEMQNPPETANLDEDLIEMLSQLPDGEYDLGADFTGDLNGIAALKAHFGLGGDSETGEGESEVSGPANQDSDRDIFTPDANGMVGPFETPADRAKYAFEAMKDAIVDWLEEKWPIIVGIITGAIAGAVALIMIGGPGLAFAVAGLVFTALDVAFGIQTAGEIMLELFNYVDQAIKGNSQQAAQHLAKALCLIAMEVVLSGFDYRTPDAPSGVHRLPDADAIPPTPHVPNNKLSKWNLIARLRTKSRVRPNGDLISEHGDKVSAGKFHLQSPDTGDLSEPKGMLELGGKLAEETRFSGFTIELLPGKLRLYGKINPKHLIAEVPFRRSTRQRTDAFQDIRPTYDALTSIVPGRGVDGKVLFNDHMKTFEEFISKSDLPPDAMEDFRLINLRKNQGVELPDNAVDFADQLKYYEDGKLYKRDTGNWINDPQIDNYAEYDDILDSSGNPASQKAIGQDEIKDETGFTGTDTFGDRMDGTMANRENAVNDRDQALNDPNLGKHSQEYKDANRDVIKASEEAGEIAAEAFAKQLDPNAQKRVSATGGSAAGEFDQVYSLSSNRMAIIEAKGGTSSLGSRQTGTQRSQQGTGQYVDSIIDIMVNHSNSAVKNTGNNLQQAKQGNTLDYYLVRQPIVNGEAGDIIVKKFKL